MSETSVPPAVVPASRREPVALPSERPTPGTDPAHWLGKLSRKNRQLAKTRLSGPMDAEAAIRAEWTIVTALLRAKATDADIAAFLRRFAVGERVRSLSKSDDVAWVARMRRRWNDPTKRQKMQGRQSETVRVLDDVWARMDGRWTAFIGFLGLSVKMQMACSLGEVTCAQREVEAFTGTPGQTVWPQLRALPFVKEAAKATVATGTEFSLIELPTADPVPFRPSRRFVLNLARHPAVTGKVLNGRLLLTYATAAAAGGTTTVEQVATAWGLSVPTARDWLRATAAAGALVLADDETVTLGKTLDDIAAEAGVLDAARVMKKRHDDEREAQRKNVADHKVRKQPTERFDAPVYEEEAEPVHPGTVLTRLVAAVDSPSIRLSLAIRVARELRDEVLHRCGGNLNFAAEAAWVVGAAVTAWAWGRDSVRPGKVIDKHGPLVTAGRRALDDYMLGRSDADVLARAGRAGAKVRKPLTDEQKRARREADTQRRVERAIAREQTLGRPQRPLLAVTPRIYQDLPRARASLALEVQRQSTEAVMTVRSSGVVEDAPLTAAWRRSILDAVRLVEGDVKSGDVLVAATTAAVAGLRAALPGVLVPGAVVRRTPAEAWKGPQGWLVRGEVLSVCVELAGETELAPVVRLAPRTERKVAA